MLAENADGLTWRFKKIVAQALDGNTPDPEAGRRDRDGRRQGWAAEAGREGLRRDLTKGTYMLLHVR